MTLHAAALAYHAAGLCVLPARLDQKRPPMPWTAFQACRPGEPQLRTWFADAEALCIICGAVSGHLELIDFDQRAELFPKWKDLVDSQAPGLVDKLYLESTQNAGKHALYRTVESVGKSQALAIRALETPDGSEVVIQGKRVMPRKRGEKYFALLTLIETKGEGGLVVCAPSKGYVAEQGSLSQLPLITAHEHEILIDAARSLNEHIPEPVRSCQPQTMAWAGQRPGDDYNQRGDVRAVLQQHGWTLVKSGDNEYWRRPGKADGWSATLKANILYVFSSSADPFEPQQAYSPFSVYTLLEHHGDFGAAASALREQGYGDDPRDAADVDLTCLLPASPAPATPEESSDPGPVPERLLRVPGFISELMDHSLHTAPYPNLVMAFCGALAFQAFLAGRKVRDVAGNRTNLYLLGLAHSATGKDWPRRINMRIAHQVGLAHGIAERFASGEGLQDALYTEPCMLFQTDEIDGLLRQVNGAQDARHESIVTQLLMMYSSASSVLPMRKLAKQEHRVIDQPCLVLFGTAIPNHYYDALSSRMLTNGLFARTITFESGPRAKGKDALEIDPPARVMEIAKWWAEFLPGQGNLRDWHPIPVIVEHSAEAKRFLAEAREMAEAEYASAEARNDPLATTVWGRADEQARKLALLYAISESHAAPHIGIDAVRWAHELIAHQTRRMLYMATNYVADNAFEADCLKLIRKLRESGGSLQHSSALKNMHMTTETFHKLIQTLEQRGQVEIVIEPAPKQGRPTRLYRLLEG